MVDFPYRGQQAPEYWDNQLKEYIDLGDIAAVAAAEALVDGEVAEGIAAHEAESDPHPQYETSVEAQAKVNNGIADHVAESDPHPQYLTEAAAASTYETIDGSPGEIAYAQNRTNTPTTLNGVGSSTPVAVDGCTITVPATTRPVWLMWACEFGISGGTAVSQGKFVSVVYETTGGSAVAVDQFKTSVPAEASTLSDFADHHYEMRVGPADHTRVFQLYGRVDRDGGAATLTGFIRNLSTQYGSSWIAAVAK